MLNHPAFKTVKNVRYNKDRQIVPDVGPLKDGEYLRISATMMDNQTILMKPDDDLPIGDVSLVRHTRGFVGVPTPVVDVATFNAQASESYAERKDRLSRAWMLPVPKPATPPFKKDAQPAGTDVESLLQARDQRLTNAWRTPAPLAPVKTDATTTTIVPSLDGRLTATAEQVDAAFEAKRSRIEGAWKQTAVA